MKKSVYAFIGKAVVNVFGIIIMGLVGFMMIVAFFGSEQPMRDYHMGKINFSTMVDRTMDSVLDGMGCPQVSTNSVSK